MLDLALIVEHLLDMPALKGRAVLLREDGTRMAANLLELIGLEPAVPAPEEPERLFGRLAAAGYATREADMAAFLRARSYPCSLVSALADHPGKPAALLVPQR